MKDPTFGLNCNLIKYPYNQRYLDLVSCVIEIRDKFVGVRNDSILLILQLSIKHFICIIEAKLVL